MHVHTQAGDTHRQQRCGQAHRCGNMFLDTQISSRDSCKVSWRLGYLPVLGLAIGPCPHPPRLSQTHSGTLRGAHGRTCKHKPTDTQTHHPPHGAITCPSRLCPVSLNVFVLGHRPLSLSQPQMSPQTLSPSGSLISFSPENLCCCLCFPAFLSLVA